MQAPEASERSHSVLSSLFVFAWAIMINETEAEPNAPNSSSSSPTLADSPVSSIKGKEVEEHPQARWFQLRRWTQSRMICGGVNLLLFLYGFVAFGGCLATWSFAYERAPVIATVNRHLLVASVFCIVTSLVGLVGVFRAQRKYLAISILLMWLCFALIASVGYLSYKQNLWNLRSKLGDQWRKSLTMSQRVAVQANLHCCGYLNPGDHAAYFQMGFAKSLLPGCQHKLWKFEHWFLATTYISAFSLVPVHIAVIVLTVLNAGHITHDFGMRSTPNTLSYLQGRSGWREWEADVIKLDDQDAKAVLDEKAEARANQEGVNTPESTSITAEQLNDDVVPSGDINGDDLEALTRKFACTGLEKTGYEDASMHVTEEQIPVICQNMWLDSYAACYQSVMQVRKFLSQDNNVHRINVVLEQGVLGRLRDFLLLQDGSQLPYETAWVITNIAAGIMTGAGNSQQTQALVDAQLVQALHYCLEMDHYNLSLKTQAAWALSNIAGDSHQMREVMLHDGIMLSVITLLVQLRECILENVGSFNGSRQDNISAVAYMKAKGIHYDVRVLVWALSNMCRGGFKMQDWAQTYEAAFSTLAEYVHLDDNEINMDACWGISRILSSMHNASEFYRQLNLEPSLTTRLVALCGIQNLNLQTPALRTIINIASGPNKHLTVLLQGDPLPMLKSFLHRKAPKSLRRDALLTIANIAAGDEEHVQAILADHELMQKVQKYCRAITSDRGSEYTEDEWKITLESAWILSNVTSLAHSDVVLEFLGSNTEIAKRLTSVLKCPEAPTPVILKCLDAVVNIINRSNVSFPDGNRRLSMHIQNACVIQLVQHGIHDIALDLADRGLAIPCPPMRERGLAILEKLQGLISLSDVGTNPGSYELTEIRHKFRKMWQTLVITRTPHRQMTFGNSCPESSATYHVRFEDEHPPLDDDLSSSDGSVPSSPLMDTMDTKSFFGRKTKNGYTIADLHPESLEYPAFETYNDSAAFDTSILRSPQKGNKKRSNGALDTINPVAKKLVVSNGFGDAQNVLGEEDFLAQAGNLLSLTNTNADKPYKCPVPGCDKAYKNPNGLKYHNQHGHCNAHASLDGDKTAQKPFGCPVPECGKRYKNLNGLKYHLDHSHMPVLHNMSAASSVLASLGVSGTTFEPRLIPLRSVSLLAYKFMIEELFILLNYTMDPTTCYKDADAYWTTVSPTVNGMLGGFGKISPLDVASSLTFINEFVQTRIQTTLACDCGAGIGRVTKNFLLKVFDHVDMVEQNAKFVKQAQEVYVKEEVEDGRVQVLAVGLQDFQPTRSYDVIWCQWVLGHLTDDDFIAFFQKCKAALRPNGLICVKENNAKEGVELDEQDSSVTRSDEVLKDLWRRAGLKIVKEQTQKGFPAGLYTVRMYALE
ncbi:hypothetical protein BZG36_00012 [Bifiguratus adelaidae]|uniref:Alpha N-terminal protein methyltransferase 1 n=1 Tax=Bifiguratus adelaidae TaxID=1938954 RepID=A0A261Y8W3_9FUNG|nr:hypothetical protein BZG36_00012 [Bifiguratus adelaidae]